MDYTTEPMVQMLARFVVLMILAAIVGVPLWWLKRRAAKRTNDAAEALAAAARAEIAKR